MKVLTSPMSLNKWDLCDTSNENHEFISQISDFLGGDSKAYIVAHGEASCFPLCPLSVLS